MINDQSISRREAVQGFSSMLLSAAAALEGPPNPSTSQGTRFQADNFTFVHLTDAHIQSERGALAGVKKALASIAALRPKPAFLLVGGDIVHAASIATRKHAEMLYDLWQEAAAEIRIPVNFVIGNSDLYAISGANRVAPDNPDYGKNLWMRRLAQENRFRSFEHQGWKFILLDSVQVSPEGNYFGEIDAAQLAWLDDLLRKTERSQPLVFLTHIPILTAFGLYTQGTTSGLPENMIVRNGKAFIEMTGGYNVKAVLQGHTHVVEECLYRGSRFITGGAVCGGWWKGPNLGVHPEGFGVIEVHGDTFSYRYRPYGWKPVPVPEDASTSRPK
ncbi:MAG: metallophosphoesterase [Verrucomicrobia bacterium]|nr:metallophosphoesterase [Deltaproteobacteria bacterium]